MSLCNNNLVYLLPDRNKEPNETSNLDYYAGLVIISKKPVDFVAQTTLRARNYWFIVKHILPATFIAIKTKYIFRCRANNRYENRTAHCRFVRIEFQPPDKFVFF